MPALNEEQTIQSFRFRMGKVREDARIDEDDPFGIVLDTVADVNESTLKAAWRTREGHEKAAASLQRATSDLRICLVQLEKKIDLLNKRVVAAQKRSSVAFAVCAAVVAICVGSCLTFTTWRGSAPTGGNPAQSCAPADKSSAIPSSNDPTGSGATEGERVR